jgi:hypothetical protein
MNAFLPLERANRILRSVQAGYKLGAQRRSLCMRRRRVRRVMPNLHVIRFCLCWVCVAEQQAPRDALSARLDAAFTISNNAAIIPRSAPGCPCRSWSFSDRVNSGVCSRILRKRRRILPYPAWLPSLTSTAISSAFSLPRLTQAWLVPRWITQSNGFRVRSSFSSTSVISPERRMM